MKGITGILRPNGEFISCDYGNHCVIAKNIPTKEEELCIYFSSSIKSIGTDKNSIIYFSNNITQEQLLWIIRNISKLDLNQYIIWINYVKGRHLWKIN